MLPESKYPPTRPQPIRPCTPDLGSDGSAGRPVVGLLDLRPAGAAPAGAAGWSAAAVADTDRGRRTDSTADFPAVQVAGGRAATAHPVVGAEFHGFLLVEEVGRGSFARVYLARQTALGGRPVIVKVTTASARESCTLAGLSHPHIVPVHSAHQAGDYRLVCMPYQGTATLADVYRTLDSMPSLPVSGRELFSTLRTRRAGPPSPPAALPEPPADDPPGLAQLDGRSYVEAVLWVAARLADALAHAHDRGVVHRDLKPANVLLADDGRPVLLDFNLAAPATAGDDPRGGTPHYMAPEQLAAFAGTPAAVDGRADLYALGVVLFELLTRRSPFPRHRTADPETLRRMTAERAGPPPRLREHNRAVSPAAEAVVRRCLEPDPARRYQTAHELRDDLERHLAHRPLRHTPEPSARERVRKWGRRNRPLLTLAVGLVAAATAAAVVTDRYGPRGGRLARLEAAAAAREFAAEAQVAAALLADGGDPARLDEGVRRAEALVARTDGLAPGMALAERDRQQAGELLALLARVTARRAVADAGRADPAPALSRAFDLTTAALACYPDGAGPRPVWEHRAELARLLGRPADARPAAGADDRLLVAHRHLSAGDFRSALAPLQSLTRDDPHHLAAWYLLGVCNHHLSRPDAAAVCFTSCVLLRPDFDGARHRRDQALGRTGDVGQARPGLDRTAVRRVGL